MTLNSVQGLHLFTIKRSLFVFYDFIFVFSRLIFLSSLRGSSSVLEKMEELILLYLVFMESKCDRICNGIFFQADYSLFCEQTAGTITKFRM